jgi:DNA-binding transcriptional ArsR family regulator
MDITEFVHDATPPGQALRVEVRSGCSFELLIGLSALTRAAEPDNLAAASPELRRAVERVGIRSGELWLHLLGLALDEPDDIVGAVRDLPGAELRRHLAGVYVPAWRTVVGADALERTAAGDPRLLRHERYYAGRAHDSLALLLPLTPAATKRRVLEVLVRFEAELFDDRVLAELERDAGAKRSLGVPPEELIEIATGGYRYEPEPELGTVVLIPHVAGRPWLLLCQHERTRIICYPLRDEGLEQRAVALGRALADDGRIRMLRRLANGDASLAELAEAGGLAKSTAHHHLTQLRAAGLVTMHGNARAYWFSLRPEGLRAARRLIGELAAP